MNDQTSPEQPKSPYEMLALYCPDAPSKEQIEAWKAEVPGGNLAMWSTPDGRRFFLMRGMSGLELKKMQSDLPPNVSPENAEYELALLMVEKCCVWTNMTRDHKLTATLLRAGTAGLPGSLRTIVENLSDFFAPAQLFDTTVYL